MPNVMRGEYKIRASVDSDGDWQAEIIDPNGRQVHRIVGYGKSKRHMKRRLRQARRWLKTEEKSLSHFNTSGAYEEIYVVGASKEQKKQSSRIKELEARNAELEKELNL